MKLGLLGYPIAHSLSPKLYREFLGDRLTSYELFPYPEKREIPPLKFFQEKLDGLNITSPYKTHFIDQVKILSPLVNKIGAVNTLAFAGTKVFATNTDLLAVDEILKRYLKHHPDLELIILGDGVMGKMTQLVAESLVIPYRQFYRKKNPDLEQMDFSALSKENSQILIINACSRAFVFQGQFSGKELFWDYNYNFPSHQHIISQVKSYSDGQEMLELQARAAIKFWNEVIPKLK